MAWTPLPPEPPAPGWWHPAPSRKHPRHRPAGVAGPRAALAARVRRHIRDIDAALIAACDCGYSNGCRWCRPGVD
jgi:hypothetical protein